MSETVPRISPPIYSWRLRGTGEPGNGPRGFAAELKPLPLATTRVLPSLVTRTLVGNQPTGMNPSDLALPAVSTSNTATLLLLALATKSSSPSGESARLLGIEPGGAFGNNDAVSLSVTRPVAVSITLTELRFASATNSRPSGASSISFGCAPTGHRATSAPVVASSTSTADWAQRLTNTRPLFSSATHV